MTRPPLLSLPSHSPSPPHPPPDLVPRQPVVSRPTGTRLKYTQIQVFLSTHAPNGRFLILKYKVRNPKVGNAWTEHRSRCSSFCESKPSTNPKQALTHSLTLPAHPLILQDSSPQSRSALDWTVDNLITKGDRVSLVSIIDSKSTATYSPPSGVPIDLDVEPDKEQLSKCNTMLAEYQKIAKRKSGDVKASAVVSRSLGTSSDHGREICEYAAEMDADTLVVGSRGHGSFKRSIMGMFGLGSVSNFVIQHAPVPNVMVHKSDGKACAGNPR